MEMRRDIQPLIRYALLRYGLFLLFMLPASCLQAQPAEKKYTINNGRMEILLGKNLDSTELKQFIKQYDLGDLALPRLLRNNFKDSVISLGWKIEVNDKHLLVISKPLFSAENINDPATRIKLTGTVNLFGDRSPVSLNNEPLGYNVFRNNNAFTVKDSMVSFLLRNKKSIKNVRLAGNFTNWESGALPMLRTDSGWVLNVKLVPGKYLYKFIADGNWLTDPDNKLAENDGEGNVNSVYFVTNAVFKLGGFPNAKKVILSGSFNHWQEDKLRMNKTAAGWELPVFLDTGTYTYRFIADGQWLTDPANPNRYPNEFNEFNSVIHIGTPTLFKLANHLEAKKVFLVGSFNEWRDFELQMTKTAAGWEIPYILGAGNYEYKFYADGQWLDGDGKPIKQNAPGSIFISGANHSFHLKGYPDAKRVFLAGDFNSWSLNAFPMKKEGDGWVILVYLTTGKHLYKFVVDGEWIKDPGNNLWEKNEFDGDNSILWVR